MDRSIATLFGFTKAAVLFKQANGPNLYKIVAGETEAEVEALARTQNYSEENVVAYPANMGITGKACE
jgi:hypothetical protein